MSAGDVVCQTIQRRNSGGPTGLASNDWARTARFGTVGLTLHGPYFLQAFRWLDRIIPVQKPVTLRAAVYKSLVGQVCIFPVYVTSFFLYMGALEGLSPQQCVDKARSRLPTTLVTGGAFWTTVNIANFMFLPPSARVTYVNLCGLAWNTFLSLLNSTGGQLPVKAAAAEATA